MFFSSTVLMKRHCLGYGRRPPTPGRLHPSQSRSFDANFGSMIAMQIVGGGWSRCLVFAGRPHEWDQKATVISQSKQIIQRHMQEAFPCRHNSVLGNHFTRNGRPMPLFFLSIATRARKAKHLRLNTLQKRH